jgi:hypothetical protein
MRRSSITSPHSAPRLSAGFPRSQRAQVQRGPGTAYLLQSVNRCVWCVRTRGDLQPFAPRVAASNWRTREAACRHPGSGCQSSSSVPLGAMSIFQQNCEERHQSLWLIWRTRFTAVCASKNLRSSAAGRRRWAISGGADLRRDCGHLRGRSLRAAGLQSHAPAKSSTLPLPTI